MPNASTEIKLETKLVGEITGNFLVPSYQRGFRWGADEVSRLLEDVYSNGVKEDKKKNYCLQPIVVRRNAENEYELIDGQQRLTTIFLIYKFLHKESFGFMKEPSFSLFYQTRKDSQKFLENIDLSLRNQNIDFFFMANAYETIEKWFQNYKSVDYRAVLTNINTFFAERVRVIWYEVGAEEDSIALFTRLNIGKIPLTNAELVKAMFLSRDNNKDMSNEWQEEIALQWDNTERELHNSSLWFFLTNNTKEQYQTRIDLILDLIAEKSETEREKYYTFFYIERMQREGKPLKKLWNQIQQTFLILKDWWEDHELYHKIGYLIASKTCSLVELYKKSDNKPKDVFKQELDDLIKKSIDIGKNYSALSYENKTDYHKISRLLLLFNVESVRQNGEQSQWFPFDKFKNGKNGNVRWSLEHIHAQRAELDSKEAWKKWLELHIISIKAVAKADSPEDGLLLQKMKEYIDAPTLRGEEFAIIQEKVFNRLSTQGNAEYLNSISNLALLNTVDNAVLSNSVFDVKRNEIIAMDMAGKYIPFCTKMAFLKYYTKSNENSEHFWGQPDRIAYINNINRVLQNYLTQPIEFAEGE